jgi:hypothetical protein
MALNFECNNTAEIVDVAIKKGKKSDGNSPSLIFKIKCIAPGSILKPLLGGDNFKSFWRKNTDKDVMYPGIKRIESVAKFSAHAIEFAGAEFLNAKITDCKAKPLVDEEVELQLKVTILDPSDEQIHNVKTRLSGTGHLKISGLDLIDQMEDEEDGDSEEVE